MSKQLPLRTCRRPLCRWLAPALAAALACTAAPAAAEELGVLIERIEGHRQAGEAEALADLAGQAAGQHLDPERLERLADAGDFARHVRLIRLAASQLDQAERDQIRQALLAGPVASDRLVNELPYAGVAELRQALYRLGAVEPEMHLSLLRGWIQDSPQRERLGAGEAAELVQSYEGLAGQPAAADGAAAMAGDPAFQTLVDHAHWRFFTRLSDDAEGLREVNRLAVALQGHLSERQRAEALEHLRQTQLDNPAALRRMSVEHFREALRLGTLLNLGEREHLEAVLGFVEQAQVLPAASSGDLTFLFELLEPAPGAGEPPRRRAAEGQARVVAIVLERLGELFQEERPLRERLELMALLRLAFDGGNDAQRRQIRAALLEQLDDPARAAAALEGQLGHLLRGNLDGMDDADLIQPVLAAYLQGSDTWRQAQTPALASLYVQLRAPRDERARAARQQVLEQAMPDLSAVGAFLDAIADHDAAQDPLLLAHLERLVQAEPVLTASMLSQLADLVAEHPDPAWGRQWLLDRLVTHLDDGGELVGEFEQFRAFASIAVDFKLEQELRQLAVTPEGDIRLSLAKVLAWVYSDRESMHAWREYLEDAAGQPDLAGDAQAHWLLARAYAALVPPAELSAIVGLNWLERAFAAAESEALRLDTLEQLVEMRVEVHDFQGAQNVLASVQHQFESEAAGERIAELLDEVAGRWQAQREHERRVTHQRELSRMAAQVQAMQRRVAQARQQQRPAEDVASMERLVAALQQELEEAREQTP